MSKAKIPANTKSRTCVLILGMHRSGTSALAGVLSRLGCELPAHQMEPSKNNPKGFFESPVVRDFNDELLATAGSSWDDITEFPEDWLRSPQASGFHERAISLLRAEFGNAPLFVLKDPRICRLVPFWMHALERIASVKPILTIRNPLDVGQSLLGKRNLSEPLSQMIWLRHTLDAERATRNMLRFHTSFEHLMRGWESVAQDAQEKLQLVWPKPIVNAEFDVAKFLSGDLQHHRDSPNRALTSTLLPDWLCETYRILSAWAESGEIAEDHQRLDRIKTEFDVASDAFARLVRAEREGSQEIRQKAHELEEANSALQAEVDRIVVKSRKQRSTYETTLAQQAAAKDAEIDKIAADTERQRATLEQSLAEHKTASEHARESLEARLATLAAEAESQYKAVEQTLEDQKSSSRREREALEAELSAAKADADQEIGALKKSVQEQRRRTTLLNGELHELKEAHEATEAELQASRARRKEMARLIARRDAEIQARYQELAVLERRILRSSLSWRLGQLWRRFKHLVRSPAGVVSRDAPSPLVSD